MNRLGGFILIIISVRIVNSPAADVKSRLAASVGGGEGLDAGDPAGAEADGWTRLASPTPGLQAAPRTVLPSLHDRWQLGRNSPGPRRQGSQMLVIGAAVAAWPSRGSPYAASMVASTL